MRFNPRAGIDASRVDDASGSGGGVRGRLPAPTSAGGGRLGLALLVLGVLLRLWQSRRRSAAATR